MVDDHYVVILSNYSEDGWYCSIIIFLIVDHKQL